MVNAIIKATKEGYDEGGVGSAIVVCILLLGLMFGIYCGIIGIAVALWNGCLVALFPVIPHITFWKMWGIYLLFDILVKPVIPSNNG